MPKIVCMANQPNVVLICVDQWRGDCLSVAGHPVVHTPYLDSLALSGVRFDRTYAACPTCIAARASLYTGLTQRTHWRVGYRDGVPWNYPVTIASEFTRQGYQTQAVGKMHVYPERSQLGFQNVELHDGHLHFPRRTQANFERVDDYLPWLRRETGRPDADFFEHGVNCNSHVARPWDKAEYLHPTNWVTSRSIDFLRRRDERKPFFLYFSYHRPHPPYDPPAWAFEQYINAKMPEVPIGDWSADYPPIPRDKHSADTAAARLRPDLLQRARAGYYGLMTHIDHQINRFLESLVDYNVGPTIVCFVSDHGELMGDHDRWRKSVSFEGSARVPLILNGGNEFKLARGSVRNELIELRDIMPTLLDAAGLNVPASVEGRSFLPIARGEPNVDWRAYLHGEHTIENGAMHYITDHRWKYIWHSGTGRELLFDLQEDPTELRDLSHVGDAAGELRRLRGLLVDELAGREEQFVGDKGQLVAGRPVRPVLTHVQGN